MSRILLTGGSGFIAAHILDTLLQRGHSVVTTVRSGIKGQRILDAYPENAGRTLHYVNVEDMARPGGKGFCIPEKLNASTNAILHANLKYAQDGSLTLLEYSIRQGRYL